MNSILRFLMRLLRTLPLWVHVLGARVIRPRYRVGVVAAVFDEQGRVLLFKHSYRKLEWGLPAGGLEYGEAPEAGIQREFLEESGISIQVEKLLMAVSSREDHHIALVYRCKLGAGEFRPNIEITEMKYFWPDELPRMLFAEKDMIARISEMVQGKNHELA
jgi:ADP-ribose pyrophosphatase YjhB (NUDIX family)